MSRLFRLGVIMTEYECSKCSYSKVRGMDYIMHVFGRLENYYSEGYLWQDGTLEPNRVSQIPIDEAIGSIDTQRMRTAHFTCTNTTFTHKDPDFERRVREATTQFTRDFRGLCLTCVRTGNDHEAHTSEGESSAE